MIADTHELQSIQKAWKSVRIYEAMMDTHLNAPPLSPFGFLRGSDFNKLCYSLLIPLAFSVLENALNVLHTEGKFASNKVNLNALMHSSRNHLPWQDFTIINLYRERRNEVAHDRKLVSPKECKDILDKIENELVAWGILAAKIKGSYTLSIGTSRKDS